MNGHENCRYRVFARVEAFGRPNAADFEPDTEAALRFAAITRIMRQRGAAVS